MSTTNIPNITWTDSQLMDYIGYTIPSNKQAFMVRKKRADTVQAVLCEKDDLHHISAFWTVFTRLSHNEAKHPATRKTPQPLKVIHARQLKEGLSVFASNRSFTLQRRDGKLAKTAQRTIGAFARKYHLKSIYRYQGSLDGLSKIEVTF